MKKVIVFLLVALSLPCVAQDVDFDKWFDGGTLRVDCIREGSSQRDSVWVCRWVNRGAAWHGSRVHLLDPFDNGDYRVVLRDPESGTDLYSRGYSNLFREYKDTPEGRRTVRRFEETLLVPMPRKAVDVVLQCRDSLMRLHDQAVVRFDPATARYEHRSGAGQRCDLELHGDPSRKIDVAIVAQGYGQDDSAKLAADYRRMTEVLFGKEPFASHRNDFNVRGVKADVGAAYGTFGADRYLMTLQVHRLHDALHDVPADHIVIMVNNEVYGGGAIYNFYSVSSLHRMAEYVLPHELGHGIGGLADEYVDEDLSYADLHRTSYEPLEPNITNLVDFGSKWQRLVAEGTPVPTPADDAVPRNECGPVGLYEGAGYSSKGVYRPTMRCMMRDYAPFCPVCRERMEAVFKLYAE